MTPNQRRQRGFAFLDVILVAAVTAATALYFINTFADQSKLETSEQDAKWALSVATAAKSLVSQTTQTQSLSVGTFSNTEITPQILQSNGALPPQFPRTPASGSEEIIVRNEGPANRPQIGILVLTGRIIAMRDLRNIANLQSSSTSSLVYIESGATQFRGMDGLAGNLSDYGLSAPSNPQGTAQLGAFAWTN